MTERCEICGGTFQKSREADLTRYHCAHCEVLYYVYAPTEPPQPIRTSQELEKPSIFALLFPFVVVGILELLYHLL